MSFFLTLSRKCAHYTTNAVSRGVILSSGLASGALRRGGAARSSPAAGLRWRWHLKVSIPRERSLPRVCPSSGDTPAKVSSKEQCGNCVSLEQQRNCRCYPERRLKGTLKKSSKHAAFVNYPSTVSEYWVLGLGAWPHPSLTQKDIRALVHFLKCTGLSL